MEFFILIGLILLNGILAMSELAVVSTNTSKLQQEAEDDNENARVALELAQDSNRFLSTVQVGITLVGVFAGALGGATISRDIADFILARTALPEELVQQLSLVAIVLLTTYLSLVIGELVPKRIALSNPERFAKLIARPMNFLSKISAPLVWFLSKSTSVVIGLIGIEDDRDEFITDFEVISMMREGIESGEFDEREHEMVKGALELDDIQIRELATPRVDIVWIDVNATEEEIREKIGSTTYSVYPVCNEKIEEVIGVVRSKDLLSHLATSEKIDLRKVAKEPFYVPQTAVTADVLQKFKTSLVNTALLLDEYGGINGIVTLSDIVEAVLGDLNMTHVEITERKDGSWLVDGQYPVIDLPENFEGFQLPENERSDYRTVAGFVLKQIGHIPETSDSFIWDGYQFEVMDMDGKRVDKVLVTYQPEDTDKTTEDESDD